MLKRLIVERDAGGLSPREMAYGVEKALGQFVLSKSAGRELTDTLTHEQEAARNRALSGSEVASLFIDAGQEPRRRWGSKAGVLCGWALCGDGRKVLLSLSTATSESQERRLAGGRDLVKRGVQTPVTLPTEGAAGLTTALEAIWPKARRIRCQVPTMQHLQQKVPPQTWPEFKALGIDLREAPTGGGG